MNNKGMTLVELIITFSLLMVIIVGMFNLILDVKLDLDNKQIAKDVVEYSNILNSDIHYDLIRKRPFAIAIKQLSTSNWSLVYNENYDVNTNCGPDDDHQEPCGINGNTLKVNVSKTIGDDTIKITGSKELSVCNDIYPCAIYAYYDSNSSETNASATAKFKVIAVNKDKTKVGGYGVKYGNTIENIPNQQYIDISRMSIVMQLDSKYFTFDYPIYIVDDSINYGFKIVYPFNK